MNHQNKYVEGADPQPPALPLPVVLTFWTGVMFGSRAGVRCVPRDSQSIPSIGQETMSMKRTTFVPVILAMVGLLGTAEADELLSGTWKLTTTFRNRARNSILKLNSEQGEVTGVMLHHLGHRTPIERVHLEDGSLSFEVSSMRRGRRYTTKYQGVVGPDTIKGSTEYSRNGQTRTIEWEATRTTDEELADHLEAPPVEADIDLTDETYEVWRDHILPDSSEMAWEKIPWLSTFKDGILAANVQQKPLLLWTMNGHPLGCT